MNGWERKVVDVEENTGCRRPLFKDVGGLDDRAPYSRVSRATKSLPSALRSRQKALVARQD